MRNPDNKMNVEEQEIEFLLEEYLELKERVKPLLRQIEATSSWIKAKGSFSTENYAVSIETRTQNRLVGLDAAVEELGAEFLARHNLIQTITFPIVHVAKKP